MYIKASTEEKARAEIRGLLDTEDSKDYIENALNEIVENRVYSYIEKLTMSEEQYANLDSRLEFIERNLNGDS